MWYWIKTPGIVKWMFRNVIWDVSTTSKTVYLTFDDGPTPEITEWTMLQLRMYNVKATFFCVGKNIEAQPLLFEKLLAEGHTVGNHTYNHVNGWKTKDENYLENVEIAARLGLDSRYKNSKLQNLFRPPYGKITFSQARKLRKLGYKIIMWDVLSADFDVSITAEKCLKNITSNLANGSVIVFHDSKKAFRNLEYVLPKTLEFLKTHGYKCEVF